MGEENLSERLRRLRLERKLSVAEVARSIGVSESTYREWERGRAIQGEPYMKLAHVFQVNTMELLLGESRDGLWLWHSLQQIEETAKRIRVELDSRFLHESQS